MSRPHIHTLDLNLLKVLEALLEAGSVTAAARRLGLTQSAVSHALNRLRYALGDPLFERTARGVRPTRRAREIAPEVLGALRRLEAVLDPPEFDPAVARTRFSLAAGPYIGAVLLPRLARELRRRAPGVALHVRNGPEGPAEAIDAGRVDVAVGAFARAPERFATEPLFRERLVWTVRAGHPAARRRLGLRSLRDLPKVVIARPEELERDDPREDDRGLVRESVWPEAVAAGEAPPVLSAPDAQTALAVVAGTDLAAAVPRRLVAGRPELRILDAPQPAAPLTISLVWRRDRESPALAWLLDLTRAAGRDLEAQAEEAPDGSG